MPIKLATFDLATRTGWCVAMSDAPVDDIKWGFLLLPRGTGNDLGVFLYKFVEWLRPFLLEHKPDHIVFECPILAKETQISTLRKLYSLAGITEMVWYSLGKMPDHIHEEHLGTIKKFAGGSGRAEKADVIRGVQRWGFAIGDKAEDEADAIALWCLAVHKLDRPNGERFLPGLFGTPAKGLGSGAKRLASVKFPRV